MSKTTKNVHVALEIDLIADGKLYAGTKRKKFGPYLNDILEEDLRRNKALGKAKKSKEVKNDK